MWARTLRTLRRPSLGWIENLPYVQAAQDRVLPQHICGAIASKCKGQVQELQRRCASECGSTARHSPLPRDGDKLHTVPSFHQAKRSGCTQFILSKRRENLRVWIQDVQRRRRTAPERLQNGGRGLSPRVRSYHQKIFVALALFGLPQSCRAMSRHWLWTVLQAGRDSSPSDRDIGTAFPPNKKGESTNPVAVGKGTIGRSAATLHQRAVCRNLVPTAGFANWCVCLASVPQT